MIFTLEALQAEQGDCFIVHFGADHAPQLLLVDGGPEDVTYSQVLAPRLGQLRARVASGPLPVPLVVCSHIDDDHIGGVLDMFRAIERWPNDLVAVNCLWHNSFTALLGEPDRDRLASVLARVPDIKRYASRATQETWQYNITENTDYIYAVSSISQGDDLYRWAQHAGTTVNCGFGDLVVAPADGAAQYGVGDLALRVIGPDQKRLDALRQEWHRRKATARAEELASLIARPDDRSVTNLSSIVFLAEYGSWRMLLTGDARSDYILDGLERAALLERGGALSVPLDVLKLPHHGSAHNVSRDFFARVPARHYVISANGQDGNPDDAMLDALASTRGEGGYTVWITNYDVPNRDLKQRLDAFRRRFPKIDLRCRQPSQPSLRVDLGTMVDY